MQVPDFLCAGSARELAFARTLHTKNTGVRPAGLPIFTSLPKTKAVGPGMRSPLAGEHNPVRECAGAPAPSTIPSSSQPSYEDGTAIFGSPSSDSPLFEDGAIYANAHTDKSEFTFLFSSKSVRPIPIYLPS